MSPSKLGLVPQIMIGVLLGAVLGVLAPAVAEPLGLLGRLFVAMLKAVAPLLVMVLVMSAIANRHESGLDGRKVLLTMLLYAVGTVSASVRRPRASGATCRCSPTGSARSSAT